MIDVVERTDSTKTNYQHLNVISVVLYRIVSTNFFFEKLYPKEHEKKAQEAKKMIKESK